jgi:hypothetical protein
MREVRRIIRIRKKETTDHREKKQEEYINKRELNIRFAQTDLDLKPLVLIRMS